MKLFELTIDDENEDGVFALSFVSDPAIELYGTFFDKEQVLLSEMVEQGLFMAPILVPNKRILRVDGKGEAYEVFFTEETIKRLSQMYLEKKYQDSVTIEHGNEKIDKIVLVESWIKESATKDKSNLYNLNAPKGSWMGTFRVENEEVKEQLRNGDISAISIEGMFEHMERDFSKEQIHLDKDIEELTEEEADEFLRLLRNMIFGEPSISSSYPGEVAEEMITPNPCQEGYVAIGTKTKDGREVPNCVPKD